MAGHGGHAYLTSSVLDSTEKIRAVDKSGMINFCVDAAKHYRKAADIAQNIMVNFPVPDNIIVAGMGGSAIGGDLLKDWSRNKLIVPIEVNRDYHLPQYADKKTLVLITSYSGDTEESLSAFKEALQRQCMIYCISSGGALIKYARKHQVSHLLVPGGMPPRAALPYMFVPLLIFMEKAGLVSGAQEELCEAIELLEKVCSENAPEKPTVDNVSKTLAQDIGDSVPVVYGFGVYRSVAQRFKQQLNENSKSAAKWEVFPELDHNEIVGWEDRGEQIKYFSVVFIRDCAQEPTEIRSRIEITERIMQQAGLRTFELDVQGKSTLAKMLSTVVVGDFLSVYFAALRGRDPTPVQTINYLKAALAENGVKDRIKCELEQPLRPVTE